MTGQLSDPGRSNEQYELWPSPDRAYWDAIKPLLSHHHQDDTDAHKLIVAAVEWGLAKGYPVT